MRGIHMFAFTLLVFGDTALAEVGKMDLDEIMALTKGGQYQQALEKHLWFHEESRKSAGMGGVRLSYAISAWIELGEKYPPALEALVEVRDKDKEVLLSGAGSFNNFHDLSAINSGLGEDEDTLELFLLLDKKHPGQAEQYYIVAEDLLIERKRYDICKKYIGDPIYKYENLRHMRETQLNFTKTNPGMNNPNFVKYADQSFVDGVVKLIEVLEAIDKRDDAIEIQKRALSYFDNEQIRYAIQ